MSAAKTITLRLILGTALCCGAVGADDNRTSFPVRQYRIQGEMPLPEARVQRILNPHTGEARTLADVQAAADALQTELHKQGFVFHRVAVPEQSVADAGVVALQVLAFAVNEIGVAGNKHFDEANIRHSLPSLESGIPPNANRLATDILQANSHPAKHLLVTLSEGAGADTLDAQVQVSDSRPTHVYANLNNRGDSETGHTRLSLGAQHSNLFNRDHTLAASYTTSPEHPNDVHQYGLHYRMPLYEPRLSLSLYYSHSEVDSGTVAGFFDVRGRGTFAGLRCSRLLPKHNRYSHEIAVSLEDRHFDSDITFAGQPLGTDVRSRPLTVHYDGSWEAKRFAVDMSLAFSRNIPSGADNDDASYANARAGADKQWHATRYEMAMRAPLPDAWAFKARLSGQYAPDPLISGEQYGLGGTHSVRGFEEREVLGDAGEHVSLELWTPPVRDPAPGTLHFLTFLDAGTLRVENPQPNGAADETLSGAGVGLRWQWRSHLHCTLDAARVLNGTDQNDSGESRLHFSVFCQF